MILYVIKACTEKLKHSFSKEIFSGKHLTEIQRKSKGDPT